MTLIQSWIDSLTLLKPKNAHLFIMVTIKSIIDAYKTMAIYWSWVVALMIVCYIISPQIYAIESNAAIASRWLYELLFFATCLSTRPSTEHKKCAYFRSYIYSFLYIVAYLLVIPLTWWPTVISPWSIFFVLFFLDSEKGPKNFFLSMWYSFKMVVFNCPLLFIMNILFFLPIVLFNTVFFVNPLLYNVLGALLLPICVCTYANVYIKKLHDQFDLYFKPVQ